MGFGGSSSGANVIIKNNRRSRKSKTEKFQKSTGSGIKGIGSEKRISEADLEKIKNNLRTSNNQRQLKIFVIMAIFLILLGLVFFYFMF
ncbi:hypothetical protein RM549_10560 [Salegentibacter sp. F188]|uniref:Riboflavin synthase subunit beta n=1 Tax=Autumnicola patrickiae TaxID=3075591 RepID=A0ABU3E2R0_9FLAO|nr:hypothetical protein [Salegentibacter sp. F188]MDT0690227.1 hypothetical protein [Salegentibacter sp. F188]